MTAAPERRPMGAVDTVWLTMDRPDNLMVIDAVMMLDRPVDEQRLREVLDERLVRRYPVFSERVVPPSGLVGMPHWEPDPQFDLDRHLHRATLPSPGDDTALQGYVEEQMSRPLLRDRPLWEVHLVDGYLDGAAVLARFHHALADGVALAQVLLDLTDAEPEGGGERPVPLREGRPSTSLLGTAAAATRGALHLFSRIPEALHPDRAAEALGLAVQTGRIADKLLLGHNPESPLAGTPGVAKRAVWARPRPLMEIKRLGRSTGATVNDVLVSAVSGAIARYVAGRDGDPADLTTMVPVNLRATGEPLPRDLGNRFALVMLPLPTTALPARDRLFEAKSRMDSIKSSPEAMLTFGIINAIGRTNPDLARHVVDFFAAKAIGVTTNVIGPVRGRYLAGALVTGVLGWVPGSGEQTLGVCIFSYDDVVRVGFKADAGVVVAPESLVDAFDAELDELLRLAPD
jgi:WS/DGAT/MGAT family acyltransferase